MIKRLMRLNSAFLGSLYLVLEYSSSRNTPFRVGFSRYRIDKSYRRNLERKDVRLSKFLNEDPSRRRDRLYIIAEILEVALEGVLKTQVMYKANLSFAQLNEYLKLMLDLNLLNLSDNSGKHVYKTTSKGVRYLESYRKIRDLLKKEDESLTPRNGNSGVYLVKRGSQVICKGPF